MADKSSDLTINERRALKGYDEIDGGEEREAPIRVEANVQTDTKQLSPTMKAAFAYGEDYGKQ